MVLSFITFLDSFLVLLCL